MECEEENVDKRVRDGILSVIEDMKRIDYIKPEDVPNIDLYMDQVTTFMDKHLETTRRYSEDKLLTKTMINNYTKNNLLPSPNKKKYSKDHMYMLIFIYYPEGFKAAVGKLFRGEWCVDAGRYLYRGFPLRE